MHLCLRTDWLRKILHHDGEPSRLSSRPNTDVNSRLLVLHLCEHLASWLVVGAYKQKVMPHSVVNTRLWVLDLILVLTLCYKF